MDNPAKTDPVSPPATDSPQDQSVTPPAENTLQEQSSVQHDAHSAQDAAGVQPATDKQRDADTAAPKKKDKKNKLGSKRGIETLFRVNYNNHIQLSQLADGKANMLISINGLIISILIALISPRINDVTWVMLPVVILLVGCLTSLAFAIIASRPRLNKTPVTLDEVRSNKGNILFFGIFTRLPLMEFEQGMHELLQNPRILYDNMIRDIYSMGNVLRKKYYYLQFAYASFLTTLVVAVISFLIIFFDSGFDGLLR